MEQPASIQGLDATFAEWARALNDGELEHHYSFYDADSEILDGDYPWRLGKDEFIDHISFRRGRVGVLPVDRAGHQRESVGDHRVRQWVLDVPR